MVTKLVWIEPMAPLVYSPMKMSPSSMFMRMTRPGVKLMNASATVVLRLFRAPLQGEGAVHSPEELKLIATATRRMGLLPAFQEEIIHRAIELSHVDLARVIQIARRRKLDMISALGAATESPDLDRISPQASRPKLSTK